jgi:hypothetical protein
MTKSKLLFGIIAILLMPAFDAGATDIAVPMGRRVEVVQTPVVCIQWVRQNQSWYNYCDPVPYFARTTYGDYWWDGRWARGARW